MQTRNSYIEGIENVWLGEIMIISTKGKNALKIMLDIAEHNS